MPVLYGNGLRIVQTPNEVVISYEMVHDTRVIPLDGRAAHIGAGIKQYIGDARGHLEGDTLVVETTNFTNKTAVNGAPHSEKLKLTEWFTRIDPEMIDYRFRVDDPDTFTAPFTMRLHDHRAARVSALRILLSRRQHGGRSGAQRRARLREASCRGQGEGTADSAPDDRDGGVLGRAGRRPSAGAGDSVQVRCSLLR